jgi:TolB-like protein/Flp pilus assembly protein TadD
MPDQATHTRRLAAIFSADAVGYTRLMADDEGATLDTLNAYRVVMSELVERHGGRVVDAVGDNLLAEFPSAVGALRCAFEIQRDLCERNETLAPHRRMDFRIGINVGDIIADGERIVGDGVNIAARVESKASPGGVALSGTAFDQVEGKLPLRAIEQAPQALKNVRQPVRIFDVEEGHAVAAGEDGGTLPSVPEQTEPVFAERLAIAVLPFDNLSQDIEQEYFADGLAEDLITSLASLRLYPIISRNSSFTYKGRSVDVRLAGKELGADYLVTGSVRRAGQRVRVTAALVETSSARQRWTGRFDRELEDIFDLQDELTREITGAVGPEVSKLEMRRAVNQPVRDIDFWDCIHRSMWHLSRFERDSSTKAETWARRAIELQPNSSRAHSLLAFSHLHQAIFKWSDEVRQAVSQARTAAERGVALNPNDPLALTSLGFALSFIGDHEQAVELLERAVRINPSSAMAAWALGAALGPAGRPDDAIQSLERAIRLSPQDPLMHEFLFAMSASHFIAGRYEECIRVARQSLDLRPGMPGCLRLAASSYGYLGQPELAERYLQPLRKIAPNLSVDHLESYMSRELAERYMEGLRLAGWN